MTGTTEVKDGSFVYCPECNSVNIYRWFCGEYTCQDCHKLFGVCEEPKRFRQIHGEVQN